jgi:3-hydroxybutyryl-CoA dehydratase
MEALRFEDVQVGQTASLEVRLAPETVDVFARLTGDTNPLHTSEEFARQKGFGGRVAHGLLVSSFFSTIAGTMLPGRDCILQSVRFEYRNPILVGETVTLEAKVAQKSDAVRVIQLDLKATGADGAVRLTGRMQAGFLA